MLAIVWTILPKTPCPDAQPAASEARRIPIIASVIGVPRLPRGLGRCGARATDRPGMLGWAGCDRANIVAKGELAEGVVVGARAGARSGATTAARGRAGSHP